MQPYEAQPDRQDVCNPAGQTEKKLWHRDRPDHYSGIRAHPHSLGGWFWHVGCGGLLQAVLLAILASTAATFLLIILPLLLFIDPLLFNYAAITVGFVVGSAVAGYVLPHYAFYRSGAAFLFITAIDLVRVNWLAQPGLFVPRDYRLTEVIPFGVLGAMITALAASLGSRWNRGFGDWLEEEWCEFLESIGVEVEYEESVDDTGAEDETAR